MGFFTDMAKLCDHFERLALRVQASNIKIDEDGRARIVIPQRFPVQEQYAALKDKVEP